MPPEDSLYSLLNVPEDAAIEEIKRAFYRMVRRERLDEDPDRFKRCHEAFQVLTDHQRRREYDQLRQFGTEVEALVVEARAFAPEESDRAIRLLKQAAVLAPDVLLPRLLLADTLSRTGDHDGAADEYRRLVARSPGDGAMRLQFARALLLAGRRDEAREQAGILLDRQPNHIEGLLLQADIAAASGDLNEAETFLNRAVDAVGGARGAAYEPPLRLYLLLLKSERLAAAAEAAERLLAALGTDEARERAAERLYEEALEFERDGETDAAARILDLLGRIDVSDEEMTAARARLGERLALAGERRRLVADTAVTNALRDYLLQPDPSPESAETLLVRLESEIAGNPARFRTILAQVRGRYPGIAREHEGFLGRVEAVADRWSSRFRVTAPSERPAPVPRRTHPRGLLPLAFAAAGLLAGFALLEWLPLTGLLQRIFGR